MKKSAPDQIDNLLADLWQKNLPTLRERLDLLDRIASTAASGTLAEATRLEALTIAHKLSGSLGMFGYQQGTRDRCEHRTHPQRTHATRSRDPHRVGRGPSPVPGRRPLRHLQTLAHLSFSCHPSPKAEDLLLLFCLSRVYFACRTAHPARSIAAANPSYSTGSLFLRSTYSL